MGKDVKTISEGRVFKGGKNPKNPNTSRPDSKPIGQSPKSSKKSK